MLHIQWGSDSSMDDCNGNYEGAYPGRLAFRFLYGRVTRWPSTSTASRSDSSMDVVTRAEQTKEKVSVQIPLWTIVTAGQSDRRLRSRVVQIPLWTIVTLRPAWVIAENVKFRFLYGRL